MDCRVSDLRHSGGHLRLAVVRHPIYASLLSSLLCTPVPLTPWQWAIVSLALYLTGTEIRVRTEDHLLAPHFLRIFDQYRRHGPAYLPFLR